MGDRCTGHCCERFYLPWSPADLERNAKDHPDDKQLQQVAGMVIFIEEELKHHTYPTGDKVVTDRKNWYTCKNFNKETRGCNIYETRPKMCSDYPYGHPCQYKDCAWDEGRAGTYPIHDYHQNMLDAVKYCGMTNDERGKIYLKEVEMLAAKVGKA
jgi:Fe-S-cluster containining protein